MNESESPAGASAPLRVLIASTSHSEPANQVRLARAVELGRHLAELGAAVDHVVLLELPLLEGEEDGVSALRRSAARCVLVGDDGVAATCRRFWWRIRDGLLPRPDALPPPPSRRFARAVEDMLAAGAHDVVILVGERIAHLRARNVRRVVDLTRLRPSADADLAGSGRSDAPEWSEGRASGLVRGLRADFVLVSCAEQARALERLGLSGEVVVAPPVAAVESTRTEPARPLRLVTVASETAANLDGLRWFRRLVLPLVARSVPSVRLRIVGEAGRFLEAGPDIDRVGWVRSPAEECALASVVVLPLRLGGGVRRRAVEALASGKALAATEPAACGLGLAPGSDAVIASDPTALARGIVEALTDDRVRRQYEARSRCVVAERFSPEKALGPLAAVLGLHRRAAERSLTASPSGPEVCEAVEPAAVS